MALTENEQASGDRLASFYNERPQNSQTNPGGFGRGGNQSPINLFIRACRDIAAFGAGVSRTALDALAEIRAQAARFEAAVAAIKAGPVSSVNGQQGAVVIDLSTISAEVERQLDEVRAAQDAIEKAQAGLRARSAAYSLAFGG